MASFETVQVGGRNVPILVAARIAEESDLRGILPSQVGDVVIPDPATTHVRLAGLQLRIETAAAIAAAAAKQGVHPIRVIASMVREQAESLERRARTRDTTPPGEETLTPGGTGPTTMKPESRARLARLLSAAELGLKDAVDSLRDAEALLKSEPDVETGLERGQMRTYAAVADANRAGIARLEELVRQHLPGESR